MTNAITNKQDSVKVKKVYQTVIQNMFKSFRLNFVHVNADLKNESNAKIIAKIWLQSLIVFHPKIIEQATFAILEKEKYFPPLKVIKDYCVDLTLKAEKIPSVTAAFKEAVYANSPKVDYDWSHPIVYLAGRDTGWEYMLDQHHNTALESFKTNYNRYVDLMLKGEQLLIPKN